MDSFDSKLINDTNFHRHLPIHNAADRDDAIQDACVKLCQRGMPVTDPLLRKTILNCHNDRVKAENRRRGREGNRVMRNFDPRVKPVTHRRRSSQADPAAFDARDENQKPSANLERQETLLAIERAIRSARLSPDHRCALRYWLRDRVAEFARRRGIPQSTVRVWAKRAKDALRPYLEREGFGPD
jgi:DNA-directed RNA polymerase specialized sigma24 family protein